MSRLDVLLVRVAMVCGLMLASALPASADVRSDWMAFRHQFPYHSQVIALGSPGPNGTRTIVISEPPPSVTFEAFKATYQERIRSITTFQQRLGFDGWVKDVAGVVPAGDDTSLQALVEDLSRDLFGTAYKAYAVDIGEPPSATGEYDLSVSSLALREWLGLQPAPRSQFATFIHAAAWFVGILAALALLKTRRINALTVLSVAVAVGYLTRAVTPSGPAGDLRPLHGGETVSLKTALESPVPGVYMTDAPGLVVLLVQRDRPLNELTVALREFALDGDLVLGAIGSPAAVAVVARERQTSVTVLPPLRTETVLQLAGAKTEELAQSYERRNLFAGSIGDTHRDWAPIFLSPELRDTEYGSLLNITDQLLKGWSEHGEIEYVNFPYPKPRSFPFEAGLLATAKASMVTYNWNTKGVGYADNASGYDVVAFGRTGALPVDYLGQQDTRMREFEDRGYDYFAGATGDPSLARVVQYAGLYQVWRHFDIDAQSTTSARSHEGPEALIPLVNDALERLRDLDADVLDQLAESQTEPEMKEAALQLKKIHEVLAEIATDSPEAFEPVARALVRPRERMRRSSLTEDDKAILDLARAISNNEFVRLFLSRANGLAWRLYAEADSKDDPDSWIKTPSIVLSWQTGARAGQGEGGHNVSSVVTRTLVDDSLVPGSVRIAEEGGQRVLYYHSSDATRIRGAVRTFARNVDEEPLQLTRNIENALGAAKSDSLTMVEALHLGPRPASLVRGFSPSAGIRGGRVALWTHAGEIPSTHATAISALNEPSVFPIVVERAPNGRYLVSRGEEIRVIEAGDGSAVMDAIADAVRRDNGQRTLHLHFKGMNEDQARPFAQVSELQSNGGKGTRVRTSVEEPGGSGIEVIGEIRRGKWDGSRATITQAAEQKPGSLQLDVSVPDTLGPRSLRMRVEIQLKNGMRATAELIDRISSIVLDVLRSMVAAGEDLDMLLAARRIKQAMRLQDESLANVQMRIQTQAGEIDVVRNVLAPTATFGE